MHAVWAQLRGRVGTSGYATKLAFAVRVDLRDGSTQVYELPGIEVDRADIDCPEPNACGTGTFLMATHVGAATVTSEGSLLFADQTENRVGVITPR
jgi:hypothetical protein